MNKPLSLKKPSQRTMSAQTMGTLYPLLLNRDVTVVLREDHAISGRLTKVATYEIFIEFDGKRKLIPKSAVIYISEDESE